MIHEHEDKMKKIHNSKHFQENVEFINKKKGKMPNI